MILLMILIINQPSLNLNPSISKVDQYQ
jgi:hypothetical protein